MHILALEPYYDGSHRAFLDGWQAHSSHDWVLHTLPGYTWKWRMRHAAITFAQVLQSQERPDPLPELLFCSDMLNLAEFLGLAPDWLRHCPTVLYFHENQLTYPVRYENERDCHFALTNLTSALAADAVWFNSDFHRQEFLDALEAFLKRMPDYAPLEAVETIRAKSQVQYPGIAPFAVTPTPHDGPLHLLWAARWEHDKNPEDFFAAIDELAQTEIDFQLSVIGQQFQDSPPIFASAYKRHRSRLKHWGFQPSRDAYQAVLSQADVVVSTATHEFFGIGMLEAISAGAYPLLPTRLAYPEILGLHKDPTMARYFYDGSVPDLVKQLQRLAQSKQNGTLAQEASPAINQAQQYLWPQQGPRLDAALEGLEPQI